MPYTCKSCGRYQQGQSADGICPLPACAATRATRTELAPTADAQREHDEAMREEGRTQERKTIAAWLRAKDPHLTNAAIADLIELGL